VTEGHCSLAGTIALTGLRAGHRHSTPLALMLLQVPHRIEWIVSKWRDRPWGLLDPTGDEIRAEMFDDNRYHDH
jgi:hypothetical protein